jgi:hypothetical protein
MFRNRQQPNNPILDELGQPIFDETGYPICEENGQEYTNRTNVRKRMWYDWDFPYDAPIAYNKAYINNNN